MKLDQARPIAEALAEAMAPHCERVEVAGSIRRRKIDVKDIEICAIPRWEVQMPDGSLFASVLPALFPVEEEAGAAGEPVNLLYTDWAMDAEDSGRLQWIKPGTPGAVPWRIRPGGKYWRGRLAEGINLDLFLPRPDNWGVILAIRTGSAEFSKALATHAKRLGFPEREGYLHGRDGRRLETPEEADVFRILGLEWVDPHHRRTAADLRSARERVAA